MGDDRKYLFDVGVLALSTAATPVSQKALDYVQKAVLGEINAVVPTPAVVGAHHVLRNQYHIRRDDAARLLNNILDSGEIDFYDNLSAPFVRNGLSCAANHNIDGWDGYFVEAARDLGAEIILAIDDDFHNVEGVELELILEEDEFSELWDYIDDLDSIRTIDDISN